MFQMRIGNLEVLVIVNGESLAEFFNPTTKMIYLVVDSGMSAIPILISIPYSLPLAHSN